MENGKMEAHTYTINTLHQTEQKIKKNKKINLQDEPLENFLHSSGYLVKQSNTFKDFYCYLLATQFK